MRVIKKTKIVEYEAYITSDGIEHTNKSDAQLHEDKLNGTKKVCNKCNGTGKINERYEREWHNTSWIPTQGEYVNVLKHDECPECKGKKYLELKWV